MEQIIFLFLAFFGSCISLLFLLTPFEKYKAIQVVFLLVQKIINFLILVLGIYQAIVIPIGVFLIIMLIPLISWIIIFHILNITVRVSEAIYYFSFLFSIVLFSYKGKRILDYFLVLIKKLGTGSQPGVVYLSTKFFNRLCFRRRIYELMIFVNIFSTMEKLIGTSIIKLNLWISYSKVSLEVLISFVAIDSYVNLFMPALIDSENEYKGHFG